MRRIAMASALLAAVALGACGGGGDTKSTTTGKASSGATAANHTPVTITLWNGFTNRELGVVKQAVDAFHQSHPWITVKVVGGVRRRQDHRGHPRRQLARRRAVLHRRQHRRCSAPRAAGSTSSPTWTRAKIDASMFPQAVQTYTQYKGKRCALPMLADTYGLYYNKDLFKKAGIAAPPKTMSELTADAKKLTVPRRRQLQGRRLRPGPGLLRERRLRTTGRVFGAQWVDGSDKSVLAKQPGWAEFMTWQKGLIDFYGYDKLRRWQAGRRRGVLGLQRVRARQAGDGHRRRVPHRVHQGRAPRPQLRHRAAAGRPTASPTLYGSGYVTGNIVGIPKGVQAQGRRLGACEVPGDRRACARPAVQRPAQRADHHLLAEVQRADARPEVQGVPRHLRPPEDRDDADHGGGQRQPGAVPELRRQVAGGQGRPTCRAAWPRSTSRSTPSSPSRRARRCHSRERDAARAGRSRAPTPGAGPPSGAPQGRVAAAAAGARPHEPVDRRLHRLLRLSAARERLPVLHALRPDLAPALGRARPTTRSCSITTRRSGTRSRTRCG